MKWYDSGDGEFHTSRSTSRGWVVKRFAKWLVFQFQPMFIQRNSCFKSFTEHDPGFISQSSIRIRFVTIHLMLLSSMNLCMTANNKRGAKKHLFIHKYAHSLLCYGKNAEAMKTEKTCETTQNRGKDTETQTSITVVSPSQLHMSMAGWNTEPETIN